jgi:hypothetical protein
MLLVRPVREMFSARACLQLFAVNFQVIFTIHNMNYGQKKIAEAAEWSQKFTTVSPTYAFEVRPLLFLFLFLFKGLPGSCDYASLCVLLCLRGAASVSVSNLPGSLGCVPLIVPFFMTGL